MDNKYCVSLVVILTLLTFMMFFRDAMKEHFTGDTIGKCMNLYSKSLLKGAGVKVIKNPGYRSHESCPPGLCQYSESLERCVPNQEHINNQSMHNYCKKEQYIENISNGKLCSAIGYTWENGICNPSVKRTEDECPTDGICQWDVEKKQCDPSSNRQLYSVDDYDSVEDYCSHLKSLSPLVSKETCQNTGESYDYNDLRQKCINVDVNAQNINDKCWGNKTMNECLNDDEETDANCIWMPTLPQVATVDDIKNLRNTELATLESEADKLDTQLQSYISSVGPYQEKLDKEQSAALIIKLMDEDDKSRYKLETGLKDYQQAYVTSLEKGF
jgi:hypothetical protein